MPKALTRLPGCVGLSAPLLSDFLMSGPNYDKGSVNPGSCDPHPFTKGTRLLEFIISVHK